MSIHEVHVENVGHSRCSTSRAASRGRLGPVYETAKVDSQTSHPARATGQCESQNPSRLISVTPVSSDRGRETYSTFRSVTIIDGAQRLPSSERSWCAVKVLSLSVNRPLQRWCVACHVQIPSRRVNVSVIAFPA